MRILLIGYGSIGRRHAEVLQTARPGAEIHLVTRREDAPHRSFRDLDAAGDLGGYDYFVISSETWSHHAVLSALLGRVRGKTILVEKPLFEAPQPVDPAGNTVLVAYNLRFHPVIAALREELMNQRILFAQAIAGQYLPTWRPGTDYRASYSASRAKGGGVLLDLSHELDYANWLFGPLEAAAGISAKVSGLEIDSDDLAAALFRSPSGAVVSISMDYLSRVPLRRITVHTERKTVLADLIANTVTVGEDGPPRTRELPGVDRNHSYLAMHRAALAGGADCCTLAEGLAVLDLIADIRKMGGRAG